MRLQKELEMLSKNPSPGVSAWVQGDDMTRLGAMIIGPEDSPYERGSFSLMIEIPPRYY
jgi:ubiquitin-protein ligase